MSRIFLTSLSLLSFTGCTSSDDVLELTSPDETVIAILEETNGGATTSFGYNVYLKSNSIFSTRRMVAALYGTMRSDCAYGLNMVWHSQRILDLEYKSTRLIPMEPTPTTVEGIEYEINLAPGVNDSSAPCGGMLYNLERSNVSADA